MIRTRVLKIIFVVLFLSAGSAYAHGPFGLGVVLGSPTGFSGNYLLSNVNSIDGAVAFGSHSNFHIHSDYLFRYPKSIPFEGKALGWYWGIGAKYRTFKDDDKKPDHDTYRFGPRGVIGMNYEFAKAPVELFGEFALSMYIVQSTDLDADFGIGVRYYF
jgi:hypothetical protein